MSEEDEQFMLRRYCSVEQRNQAVGHFRKASGCYQINVPQPPGPYIYQVYPSDPKRCLYRPLPPGQKWFLLAQCGGSPEPIELARIDSHDQYAYFALPPSATSIQWIRASTLAEAVAKSTVK